jgi:hypothetical protein
MSVPAHEEAQSREKAGDAKAGVPTLGRQVVGVAGLSNAALARYLMRQPKASVAPPAAPNATVAPPVQALRNNGINYEGELIFPDQARCKELLYKLLPQRGRVGARSFGRAFAHVPNETKASWAVLADEEYQQRCQTAMDAAATEFDEECERFMQRFETQAGNTVDAMLIHAKETILAEQAKLGVKKTEVPGEGGGNLYSVTNKTYVADAKRAAAELAPKRSLADFRAKAAKEAGDRAAQQAAMVPTGAQPLKPGAPPAKPAQVPGAPGVTVGPNAMVPEAETVRRDWQAAEEDFAKSASAATAKFPLIGPYVSAGREAADKLKAFGESTGVAAEQDIGESLAKKLDNIETVHDELGKRFSLYKQPMVLDIVHKQVDSGPGQRKLIHDKATELEEDAKSTEQMYAVIALGVGLLAAIPTGGTSILAGVALAAAATGASMSAYTAYEHAQEYRLQSATADTALDRADVISKEEPSLLFLAIDVAAAVADLGAAKAAFTALKQVIAAAKAAKGAEAVRHLPEVIGAMHSAHVSPANQARVIKEVMPSGGDVREALFNIRKVIVDVSEAAKENELAQLLRDVATRAIDEHRVIPFPENPAQALEVLAERLRMIPGLPNPEHEAQEILRHFTANPHLDGGYYDRAIPFLVLRGKQSAEGASSFLIHELGHRGQHMKGIVRSMGTMEREFEAYKVQQMYVRMWPPEMLDRAESWQRQLVHWSDKDIENHILAAYAAENPVVPHGFDHQAIVDGVFETMFRAGAKW